MPYTSAMVLSNQRNTVPLGKRGEKIIKRRLTTVIHDDDLEKVQRIVHA